MTHFQAYTTIAAILLASSAAPSFAQEHSGHGEHGAHNEAPQVTMEECHALHERHMGDAETHDAAMAGMDEEARNRMQACHAIMHADDSMGGHVEQHMHEEHDHGAAHSGHHGTDDASQAGRSHHNG